MKFRKRQEPNVLTYNFIDRILATRGITNFEEYKNPHFEMPDFYSIKNLLKGIDLVNKHKKSRILIVVDSDTDGYTSGTIFYQFLTRNLPEAEIFYYVHPNKDHGITDQVKAYVMTMGINFLIVPDAGTNDKENTTFLYEHGVEILIVDHHEKENENPFAVIINNMLDDTNKAYTGAGMSYIFCSALAKEWKLEEPKDLMCLAAVGNIADGAVLTSNQLRSLCDYGLKNITNKFLQTIMENKDIKELTIADISWKIAPIINGVCRAGNLQEKNLLFKALNDIDMEEEHPVSKRKLNKVTRKYEMVDFVLNGYEYALDILMKCRENQNSGINPIVEKFSKTINPNRQIQVFVLEGVEQNSSTGLIANKLSSLSKNPCLVVWEKENTYTGSARGNTNIMKSFKDYCTNSGLFELAQGHDNAFGVILTKENFAKFIQKINSEKFECQEDTTEYIVDEIYENGDVNRMHMKEVADNYHLWCNGCQEPLFVVKNVIANKDDIKNYRGGTLKIYSSGLSFIKYFSKKEEFENIQKGFGDTVTLDIICKFENNEYNGRVTQQGVIVDYEIKNQETIKTAPSIFGDKELSSVDKQALAFFSCF